MAYIKHTAIRSSTHITNVIKYNTKETKTNENLIAGVNCDYKKIKEEFELAKVIHGKDDCKIIAHQYFQSFKENEVSPEMANEIGVKLADKIAPGYQALIVTHIDKEHVHNHILINSVNIETGYMYKANKDSLSFVRNESDNLVTEYGLSVIKNKSGLRGIDQATYRLAEQGKSWKIKMLNSIDEAIEFSNTKDDFIKYMNDLGYEVKWQNQNISFKDNSEQKKFIRARSLAKQFTDKYSKEGIENRIYGKVKELESNRYGKDISKSHRNDESNINNDESNFGNTKRNTDRDKRGKNEFERYEEWKRKQQDDIQEVSFIDREFYKLGKVVKLFDINKPKSKNRDEAKEETFKILLAISIICLKKSKERILVKKRNQKKYKLKSVNIKNKVIGNSDYFEMNNLSGENKFIKLKLDDIYKLKNVDFKFTGIVKENYVVLMTKESDFEKLLKCINRNYEKQYGTVTYKFIKETSKKIEVRVVDNYLMKELKNNKFKFASLKINDNKYNISFDNRNLSLYKNILSKLKYKDIDGR